MRDRPDSAHLTKLICLLFTCCAVLFNVPVVYFHSALEAHSQNPVDVLLAKKSLLRRARQEEQEIRREHIRKRSSEEGLSACLLVNDENPRLPEWLAYHYYMLPLRSLIVAVDPASKTSPRSILDTFSSTLKDLDITLWGGEDYNSPSFLRKACHADDPKQGCLFVHRQRQQHFVMRCMEEFKKRGKSWVLLIDVDEYITFNRVHPEDDPPLPLHKAPEGVRTLMDWKVVHSVVLNTTRSLLSGLLEQHGVQTYVTTKPIKTQDADILYGNVVEDVEGNQYYLYDDSVQYQDPTKTLSQAPPGMPLISKVQTLRRDEDLFLGGHIFNDTYDDHPDNGMIVVRLPKFIDRVKPGQIVVDKRGRKYWIENEQSLWNPHLNPQKALAARSHLPAVDSGYTVMDILKRYTEELRFGSCLQMPRLLYGSKESTNKYTIMAPESFQDRDFATLRYLWHGQKGSFTPNKYHKTMVDVSQVPMEHFQGKQANSIHRPLIYYCRSDTPRYSTALFRVNHYLDSFEAYSYRNDARGNSRNGDEYYRKKGKRSDVASDTDITPWLKGFVAEVGKEKARVLLAGAGDFQKHPDQIASDVVSKQ